jgi:hypothetical protein
LVKIYAGNSESGTLVATLTGDTIPNSKTYTVNASQALVVFTSDNASNGEGFTFNYSSAKTLSNYCLTNIQPTRITTKAGSIDNGSGTANYDSDNSCYWAIAPEGMGNQVKFAFSKFDLAQGDVIDIFSLNRNDVPITLAYWKKPVRTFSTDNIPALDNIYTLTGPTLLIRFRTDNSLTATGFKIYWEENMSIQDNNVGFTELSIYPNPASDKITVSLTTEKEENVQISIYDMLGKVLYSVPSMQIRGQHKENIDVSSFAQGLYLLRITTMEGIITKKISIE